MKNFLSSIFTAILVLMLITSFFCIAFPFIFNRTDGTLKIDILEPVGIQIDDLWKNDDIIIDFRSEIPMEVYFLTRDEANEYRSPTFYKSPLPDPIFVGSSGRIIIEIPKKDDYEILFIPGMNLSETSEINDTNPGNADLSRVKVDYEMERHVMREIIGFMIYGTSLFIFSSGSLIIRHLRSKNRKNHDM